jgi:hypothetical protein
MLMLTLVVVVNPNIILCFLLYCSPEMMPWDTNLNQDIHLSVMIHCLLTDMLPKDDAKKFSVATPKLGTNAYLRVLKGSPSSKRIIQDVNKVLESMKAIYDAKGCLVEGLGDRNGVRRVFKADTNSKQGGKRVRSMHLYDSKHYWLHPDAQTGIQVKLEDSIVKFQGGEMVAIDMTGDGFLTGDDDEASLEDVGANIEVGAGIG